MNSNNITLRLRKRQPFSYHRRFNILVYTLFIYVVFWTLEFLKRMGLSKIWRRKNAAENC